MVKAIENISQAISNPLFVNDINKNVDLVVNFLDASEEINVVVKAVVDVDDPSFGGILEKKTSLNLEEHTSQAEEALGNLGYSTEIISKIMNYHFFCFFI